MKYITLILQIIKDHSDCETLKFKIELSQDLWKVFIVMDGSIAVANFDWDVALYAEGEKIELAIEKLEEICRKDYLSDCEGGVPADGVYHE